MIDTIEADDGQAIYRYTCDSDVHNYRNARPVLYIHLTRGQVNPTTVMLAKRQGWGARRAPGLRVDLYEAMCPDCVQTKLAEEFAALERKAREKTDQEYGEYEEAMSRGRIAGRTKVYDYRNGTDVIIKAVHQESGTVVLKEVPDRLVLHAIRLQARDEVAELVMKQRAAARAAGQDACAKP